MQDSNAKNLNPSRSGTYGAPTDAPDFQTSGTGGGNKYTVKNAQYPSDLYDNNMVYGGNYVIFYINVADDSKLLTEDNATTIAGDIPARQRGGLIGQDLSKLEGAGAVATVGAVGGVGVNAISGLAKGQTNVVSVAKDAAIGGGIGLASGGVVAAASAGMARQQKRLAQAIALHVPNQLSIRYSTEWQTEDTFAFQAAAIANREVAKAITPENILSMLSGNGAKSNVGGAAGSIATNIALSKTPVVSGAMSAASGMAANPKKEQVFKNVNFREFTFDYTFSPRNATEAANVKEIIYLFKLHMHPEYKDTNNFLFIYPSEFDIYYYQNGKENLNLHRHTSCILKDINVNYTPNGAFNTFADGMPTQINVTLSFVELAILTKELIKDKF